MAIYETSPDTGPLRQGEILSNVVEVRLATECLKPDAEPLLQPIVHPFAVVLTQDCDLDWDYRSRFPAASNTPLGLANKTVPNILLCQAELSDILRGAQGLKSDVWRRINSNLDERYHVLWDVPPERDRLGQGIFSLALDFKLAFTVPAAELYYRLSFEARRRCFLIPPFLHSLSSRFTYYMGRVGLPELESDATAAPPALPPATA